MSVHAAVTPSIGKRGPAERRQCSSDKFPEQNRLHSSQDEKSADATSLLQAILALCHDAHVGDSSRAFFSKQAIALSPKGDLRSHSVLTSTEQALESENGLIGGAVGISGAPGLCLRCGTSHSEAVTNIARTKIQIWVIRSWKPAVKQGRNNCANVEAKRKQSDSPSGAMRMTIGFVRWTC